MTDQKYLPYHSGKRWLVLFFNHGFAIKSNFNKDRIFNNFRQVEAFCNEQNEYLVNDEEGVPNEVR